MSLADGTRLEHYEIVGPLGAGGMGEVYRAVDTKLRREVALKILPLKFAADSSRLARFEREAHLLAQLNHPNIAAIYGLEHVDNIRFLVLELADGPTLSDRLKSGPIELGEALRIASGIAEALEAAHEKGVVHRDLKPGNIKITPQGKVKVLDFGLAKALSDPEPASGMKSGESKPGDPGAQSTVTLQETRAGVVMGTAAYMSPEQAEAKPTDKRSDVWSFGVVMYEMLSGKRCFDGKSTSHIIVHLLENEPDWQALPESVPAGLRLLLERCLEKDPAKRLRDVGDLRLQLEGMARGVGPRSGARGPAQPESLPHTAHTSRRWAWAGAGIAVVALAAIGFVYLRPKAAPVQAMRFDIAAPEGVTLSSSFAVSPDGRRLAFVAAGSDKGSRLWVRSLETGDARALEGTDNAIPAAPIWAPDSRSVAYAANQNGVKLMRIDTSGGLPQSVNDLGVFPPTGGFWTADNQIVIGGVRNGVRQVPAAGGALTQLIPAAERR
jgi:eukaryotic-like serine/threonine-protein kinase